MHPARLAGIRVTSPVFSLLATPVATAAAVQDMPPQHQNAWSASAVLRATPMRRGAPARPSTDLFQGETVVFPVDALDQQTRWELATCFRDE